KVDPVLQPMTEVQTKTAVLFREVLTFAGIAFHVEEQLAFLLIIPNVLVLAMPQAEGAGAVEIGAALFFGLRRQQASALPARIGGQAANVGDGRPEIDVAADDLLAGAEMCQAWREEDRGDVNFFFIGSMAVHEP